MSSADAFPYRRVWVAGHRGMVGSAVVRRLAREPVEILTVGRDALDLQDQAAVRSWLEHHRPDAVIVAAAKVGGILANDTYPADFLSQNLVIQSNIIDGAHRAGVDRLVFLGSSCIYPKFANQPITEDALLTGPLEPTNEWYAVAKIAGIKLCQAYRKQFGRDYVSVMPCNVYGPFDNFDPFSSHVVPAMIRKFHEAKAAGASQVSVWGTGSPRREFIYADDLADGITHILKNYHEHEHINCGGGSDVSIRDLAGLVANVTGFVGEIIFDVSKPDGTPRKLMSNAKLETQGWRPKVDLREGLEQAYSWYRGKLKLP